MIEVFLRCSKFELQSLSSNSAVIALKIFQINRSLNEPRSFGLLGYYKLENVFIWDHKIKNSISFIDGHNSYRLLLSTAQTVWVKPI